MIGQMRLAIALILIKVQFKIIQYILNKWIIWGKRIDIYQLNQFLKLRSYKEDLEQDIKDLTC